MKATSQNKVLSRTRISQAMRTIMPIYDKGPPWYHNQPMRLILPYIERPHLDTAVFPANENAYAHI